MGVLEDEAACRMWKTTVAPKMIPMGSDSPFSSAKATSAVPHVPAAALSSDAAADAPCSVCWTRGLCANKTTRAGNTSRCCTSALDAVEWPAQFGPSPYTVIPQLRRHSWGAGRARHYTWPAVQCRLLALRLKALTAQSGSFLMVCCRSSKLLQVWLKVPAQIEGQSW